MKKTRKTLYFEGAGWSDADLGKNSGAGNCRIRTAFRLDNGKSVYLELSGAEKRKTAPPKLYLWEYTEFINYCFYITDDKPNDDCNLHQIPLAHTFEYSEAGILQLVNSLGTSFDAVKVVSDLGGYRVFPEKHSCDGLAGYNYGDQFQFNSELAKKRDV